MLTGEFFCLFSRWVLLTCTILLQVDCERRLSLRGKFSYRHPTSQHVVLTLPSPLSPSVRARSIHDPVFVLGARRSSLRSSHSSPGLLHSKAGGRTLDCLHLRGDRSGWGGRFFLDELHSGLYEVYMEDFRAGVLGFCIASSSSFYRDVVGIDSGIVYLTVPALICAPGTAINLRRGELGIRQESQDISFPNRS